MYIMAELQTPNERFVELFNQLNFSIPEFAAECEIKSQIRTFYKVINDGHKPSPKFLRLIELKFPQFNVGFIYHGRSVNAVEENYNDGINKGKLTSNNTQLMENTQALNEMKDKLNDAILNQATMTNHFFQKLNSLEESNNKAREQMLDLHKDVLELIKTTHAWNDVREQIADHMENSNEVHEEVKEFINTVLPPNEELGQPKTVKKKH